MHEPARFADVNEVARALHLNRWTVYKWAAAGRIPSVRVGRKVLFELAAVIDALRQGPTAQPVAARIPDGPAAKAERPAPRRRAQRASRTNPTASPPAPVESSADAAERIRTITTATRVLGA